jgi:mono/diheme cytochrome c family protein
MKGATLRCLAAILPIICGLAVPASRADEADKMAEFSRGWATLRAMDCARCHGRDLDGWAAPSLLAAARDSPRERFTRWVLDGDVARGMPPYRSQPMVTAQIDAMYAYLLARALGELGPGDPGAVGRGTKPQGSTQSAED